MNFKNWSREEISDQITKLSREIVSIGDYLVDVLMGKFSSPVGAKRDELVLSYVRVRANRESKLQALLAEEERRRCGWAG